MGRAVPYEELGRGFSYEGERIKLVGPQGVFKPKEITDGPLTLLSTLASIYEDEHLEGDVAAEALTLFSGEALSTMTDTVFRALNQGVYVDGSFEMHPEVVSSTDTEVVLADCVVETNTTYDRATGAEKDSGRYVHNRRATVVNTQGVWTVAAFEQLEEPCTPQGG